MARNSPDLNLLSLLKAPLVQEQEVKRFPGESLDHVTPGPLGTQGFLTSSQCLGCHSASDENMAFLFEGKGEANKSFALHRVARFNDGTVRA